MLTSRSWAVLVLPVALLVGCGGQARTDAGVREPAATSPLPAATGSDVEDAQTALRKAVATFLAETVSSFRYEMSLGERSAVVVDGTHFARVGWDATMTAADPDASTFADDPDVHATMYVRASVEKVWMQMTAWSGSSMGCWLEMEPTQVPVGMLAMRANEPAYISVATALHTRGFAPGRRDELVGELDLHAAMNLLTGQLVEALEIPRSTYEGRRVAAAIALTDTRLDRIRIEGADIVSALEDAGVDIPDTTARLGMNQVRVVVDYVKTPASARPLPPPAKRLIRTQSMGDTAGPCRA